jgi:LacI family transcriptional regulator
VVCSDNEEAACQGVAHLIEDGHTSIGILAGMPGMSSMQERLAGYERALAEHGMLLDEGLIKYSRLDSVSAAKQMSALMLQTPRPTAVFLSNNILALGALIALQQLSLSCPADVSLVAYDDAPWMAIADPPLTVLRQPNYDMGVLAGQLLLQQLRGETVPRSTVQVSPELIVRQSCRPDRHRQPEQGLGADAHVRTVSLAAGTGGAGDSRSTA